MPKIKIPASTANMGSGFDSIGMALTMYNEIMFEMLPESKLIIEVPEEAQNSIPRDQTNLIYSAIKTTLDLIGEKTPGLRIVQTNRIPQTRGLGSSSACVVGGIIAANIISGGQLSTDEMISIAAKIEGHPDNILPTFVGGLTAGVIEQGQVKYIRLDPPKQLKCCVMIPDFQLSTKKARAVLPEKVDLSDAIYNVSRAALMMGAIAQGKLELIGTALGDRLHQQYRKELIPGYDFVIAKAAECGAIGCCLSGAGPTMIAFLEKDYGQFMQKIKIATGSLEHHWKIELLNVCSDGATWELDD